MQEIRYATIYKIKDVRLKQEYLHYENNIGVRTESLISIFLT
jgi:hypothetical protein